MIVPTPKNDIVYIVEIPSLVENQEVYQVTLFDFSRSTCFGFVFIKQVTLENDKKK